MIFKSPNFYKESAGSPFVGSSGQGGRRWRFYPDPNVRVCWGLSLPRSSQGAVESLLVPAFCSGPGDQLPGQARALPLGTAGLVGNTTT